MRRATRGRSALHHLQVKAALALLYKESVKRSEVGEYRRLEV